ncbi:DUF3817 domain-containing protein [Streptomyces sp. NA02950]|uniref:DUF3817 domain-containing protein n=1 Tax=Streptomyces sp. NA02950 TaxID=2742137 RepID=UPI001590A58A|nr:DUF3817 domain-containing protein [Streptomyces sp. NA02950]QKV90992.1 DUF3817 domain-containing protein [Streptomyces sp. NA02950]
MTAVEPSTRPLRIAATVELASLIVLLANLATAHWPAVSSATGPVHGCAYLFVIIAAVRRPGTSGQLKLLALVPGIGGPLVLRQLTSPACG